MTERLGRDVVERLTSFQGTIVGRLHSELRRLLPNEVDLLRNDIATLLMDWKRLRNLITQLPDAPMADATPALLAEARAIREEEGT